MSDREGDDRVQADLAQLRTALRFVEAPPVDEAALRAQFRRVRAGQLAARAPRAGRKRWQLAAAAVVVLGVGAALATALLRGERSSPPTIVSEPGPSMPAAVSAFQPLSNVPGLSAAASYNVVRVRIPLSAFALVPGTVDGGTIEADLLVGEDGLARAIRFNEADASLVSVAGQ